MTAQNPKFLYDNRFDDATPAASTTASGYDVLNLRDWRPYTFWKPTTMPATVTVDCGIAKPADFLALYGHDLQTQLAYVEVHGSTDNFASSDVLLASTNLLAYPEQLGNSPWAGTNAPVTANAATATDGTFTMDKIVASAINAQHFVSQDFTIADNAVLTGSALVKAAEYTTAIMQFRTKANTFPGASIDLSTGLVSATGSPISVSAVAREDGRYRVYATANMSTGATTPSLRIVLSNGGTSFLGDGASGIYAWGAQVNVAVSPAAYEGVAGRPILLQWTTASYRYYRIKLVNASGTGAPTLAIAVLGQALQSPVPLDDGFNPLADELHEQTNLGGSGYSLGRVIAWEEWSHDLKFPLVTWSWLRNTFMPAWNNHFKYKPFIFAWEPGDRADEIYLVQADKKIESPHRPGQWADLSFTVSGVRS